jgi:hypothetical protein
MHGCAPQSPLFSVIAPLEFHREHWKRCLLAWQAQTMAKSQFEVILVMPPDFPAVARDELTALLSAQDRIEYSGEIHDIGLCAVGAAAAQGAFFFYGIALLAGAGCPREVPAKICNGTRAGSILVPVNPYRPQSIVRSRSRYVRI